MATTSGNASGSLPGKPPVVDLATWQSARDELLVREKAHTREGDAIAAARRWLPMTEVPPATTVIGPDGPVPFGDVFEGRDELVVYSHMFYDGQPWEWQCEGCTRNSWNMGDAADAAYLNANGITFAFLVDGPYEEIAAFRDFMGYTAPWYSIAHLDDPTVGVAGRISCYLRHEDKIFLTYSTTGRGDEVMSPSFGLLDMTAYGRREEWEDSPEGWPQFPTHSVLRTDEHGALVGPRNGGRPVPQWTRPGAAPVASSAARATTADVRSVGEALASGGSTLPTTLSPLRNHAHQDTGWHHTGWESGHS